MEAAVASMAENFFLEMEHISKTFPGAKVLDDIELRIRPGEVRALMGENGAGKSTLIKILGGIYQMDAGGQIKTEFRVRSTSGTIADRWCSYPIPRIFTTN